MTYIDDKYKNKPKSTKSNGVTYKTENKKHPLKIVGITCGILLAIMLLISAPAFDRTERRDELRGIVGEISATITSYSASNGGRLPQTPDDWRSLWNKYIGSVVDSAGAIYEFGGSCAHSQQSSSCIEPSSLNWKDNQHKVYIATKAICVPEGTTAAKQTTLEYSASSRSFSVYTLLDDGILYCVSNR